VNTGTPLLRTWSTELWVIVFKDCQPSSNAELHAGMGGTDFFKNLTVIICSRLFPQMDPVHLIVAFEIHNALNMYTRP
jgi:hypothetical protein